MKKRIICTILISIVLIAGACGKKSTESYDASGQNSSVRGTEQKSGAPAVVDYTSAKADSQETTQKIIQNYDINIEVEDLKKTASEIENKVKQTGGYLDNEEVMDTSCYATIRIPSDKLDNFINDIEKKYIVVNKVKNSQNITDVYIDNDARLKNYKAEEIQMLDVLKKAGNVEDILKVQSELFRIRGEIESLESRKKAWDKQVDYSTISIRMNKKQIAAGRFVSIISGNEFLKVIYKGFANSFLYLILSIEKLLIFVVSNIFVLAILAAIFIFIYKKYKRIKGNEVK